MHTPTEKDLQTLKQFTLARLPNTNGYDEMIAIDGKTAYGDKWRYYLLMRIENGQPHYTKPFGFVRITEVYRNEAQIEHRAKRNMIKPKVSKRY